ncbi:DUF3363 domain-containing protein [Asticcacaulis taihuensis]|uniref:Type IV secretory pathway, VirD2 components (Relaxase) n=1 Tax=Asticcacaulis taihuensis TaxID=260084 RepID=A0A1G4PUE3_9CAUL|nr:DUF3363 domain-containing protein [Asticcacaulis taihuensis]SCW35847.1 Type IV secretory pathway, VirD2 components (relaxase) [Asticcacaulis taihuensis]
MAGDRDEVTPRLGRIRSKGGQSYLPKVLKAAQKAGGLKTSASKGRGWSRGRGAGIAAVTAGGRLRGPSARRVVVKTRYTKLAGKGVRAARAHLRYLQRDGVTPDRQAGQLYDRSGDQADGRAFMDRAAEDPLQFRLIVSAEDGDKYADLKPLTRRFMAQVEKDLGTGLDWVAVDHHNTGHPHTHIVIRGRDENGKDLVIARDYIKDGMRDRLEALVTLDLGPRTQREIDLARWQEVDQARLTSLDRHLVRTMSVERIVGTDELDQKNRAVLTGRLTKLQAFGLAEHLGQGLWRLAEHFDTTLRDMGERGDIIKSLHRELALKGMSRATEESVIHRVAQDRTDAGPLVGRVIKRGLLDGEGDRHFLMIDGVDGKVHWIDIGQADRTRPLADDALVRVEFRRAEIKQADRTIVAVAGANGGSYDVAAHLNHDQSATEAFAETHVRRLEAIRRTTGGVERSDTGSFTIPESYLQTALTYEEKRLQQAPVSVDLVSPIPLARLPEYNGATWLDRELVEPSVSVAEAGFGKELTDALRQRQVWLLQEELAFEFDGEIRPISGLLSHLETRDLTAASDRLVKETGLTYRPAKVGDRVEGQLRQSLHLPSGKFAVVEHGKEFTLVPWRPVLENHLGKTVSGIYRDEGINWSIARGRGVGIS